MTLLALLVTAGWSAPAPAAGEGSAPAAAAPAATAPAAPAPAAPAPAATAPAATAPGVTDPAAVAPPNTVEVKLLLGPQGTPVPGGTVTLQVVSPAGKGRVTSSVDAASDAAGVARFPAVEAGPGEQLVARAEHQGVSYASQPTPMMPHTVIELRLFPVTTDIATLRFGRVETELSLWEGSVQVNQQLALVNQGPATVDLRDRKGAAPGQAGIRLTLPAGAEAIHASGPEVSQAEGKVLIQGTVRPDSPVIVRVRFALPTSSSRLSLRQPLPLPADELLTVVPKEPSAMGRPLTGVVLRVLSHNHAKLDEQVASGGSYWVLGGAPAGGARELQLEIAGLPSRSRWPAWGAVIVALGLVIAGVRAGRRRAASRQTPPAGTGGGEREREELFRRLEKLERERLAQGLPATARPERELLLDRLVMLERDKGSRTDG